MIFLFLFVLFLLLTYTSASKPDCGDFKPSKYGNTIYLRAMNAGFAQLVSSGRWKKITKEEINGDDDTNTFSFTNFDLFRDCDTCNLGAQEYPDVETIARYQGTLYNLLTCASSNSDIALSLRSYVATENSADFSLLNNYEIRIFTESLENVLKYYEPNYTGKLSIKLHSDDNIYAINNFVTSRSYMGVVGLFDIQMSRDNSGVGYFEYYGNYMCSFLPEEYGVISSDPLSINYTEDEIKIKNDPDLLGEYNAFKSIAKVEEIGNGFTCIGSAELFMVPTCTVSNSNSNIDPIKKPIANYWLLKKFQNEKKINEGRFYVSKFYRKDVFDQYKKNRQKAIKFLDTTTTTASPIQRISVLLPIDTELSPVFSKTEENAMYTFGNNELSEAIGVATTIIMNTLTPSILNFPWRLMKNRYKSLKDNETKIVSAQKIYCNDYRNSQNENECNDIIPPEVLRVVDTSTNSSPFTASTAYDFDTIGLSAYTSDAYNLENAYYSNLGGFSDQSTVIDPDQIYDQYLAMAPEPTPGGTLDRVISNGLLKIQSQKPSAYDGGHSNKVLEPLMDDPSTLKYNEYIMHYVSLLLSERYGKLIRIQKINTISSTQEMIDKLKNFNSKMPNMILSSTTVTADRSKNYHFGTPYMQHTLSYYIIGSLGKGTSISGLFPAFTDGGYSSITIYTLKGEMTQNFFKDLLKTNYDYGAVRNNVKIISTCDSIENCLDSLERDPSCQAGNRTCIFVTDTYSFDKYLASSGRTDIKIIKIEDSLFKIAPVYINDSWIPARSYDMESRIINLITLTLSVVLFLSELFMLIKLSSVKKLVAIGGKGQIARPSRIGQIGNISI